MTADKFAKMAERIGKLLAKAEGTDNPHEAEAFTAQAEKLMIRYGIEEATARAAGGSGVRPEPIVEIRLRFDGRYGLPWIEGCYYIVQALGMRGYRRGEHLFYIVGYESDAKAAEILLQSLWLQVIPAMWSWWKSEGKQQWYYNRYEEMKARKSFVTSFGAAVSMRVEKTRTEVAEEVPGSALALLDREQQVNAFVDAMSLRKSRRQSTDGNAAGYRAGREANLGGTGIAGRKAVGA